MGGGGMVGIRNIDVVCGSCEDVISIVLDWRMGD